MFEKGSSNQFLRKLHVYGGLFLAFYVIVLGISSLQFQHHFVEFQPGEKSVTWEQRIQIPEFEDKDQLKSAIRDSLNLNGYLPWWKEYTDSLDIYHFMISRPGKQYWVTVPSENDLFRIDESRMPIFSITISQASFRL